MAKNQKGFKTVQTDVDELEAKIFEHRKDIFWKVMWTLLILMVMLVAFAVWTALRTFSGYDVVKSLERTDSEASHFQSFLGNIIKYSNDGVVYMDASGELIWNQSFEMNNPRIDTCEGYVTVYDKGGLTLYILDAEGVKKEISTNDPIQKVSIASQGTVAVLTKEKAVSKVALYDQKGNHLAGGEFYGDRGGFPIDIALSYDAQKLAVDMVDVSDGNIKTTIGFYNFGSVGQNEVNNLVASSSFSDLLISQIDYISAERMIAFGDNEVILFSGAQKPSISKEIYVDEEIQSVFYNEKYFGIVQNDYNEGSAHLIRAFDMRGNEIVSHATNLMYDEIEFLDNNEICVRNRNECEIYSIHGVRKFAYTFDKELYKIMSEGVGPYYIFVMDGATEEVHLQ